MRKTLAATAIFSVLALPAFAADLPNTKEAPIYAPPPALSWTGFYVGANAGYGWTSNNIATTGTNTYAFGGLDGDIAGAVATAASITDRHSAGGFIGGGQIGYNYQFANSFVAGLEADFDGLAGNHASDAVTTAGTVPDSGGFSSDSTVAWSSRLNYLGTLRGRIGALASPSLLVFATGGLAYGGISTHTSITETLGYGDTPTPFGTSGGLSTTRIGWTLGFGAEWAFLPNWSAKIEYLHYDLGRVNDNLSPIEQYGDFGGVLESTTAVRSSLHVAGDVVRVGLNYHFNWGAPAPVVAKY